MKLSSVKENKETHSKLNSPSIVSITNKSTVTQEHSTKILGVGIPPRWLTCQLCFSKYLFVVCGLCFVFCVLCPLLWYCCWRVLIFYPMKFCSWKENKGTHSKLNSPPFVSSFVSITTKSTVMPPYSTRTLGDGIPPRWLTCHICLSKYFFVVCGLWLVFVCSLLCYCGLRGLSNNKSLFWQGKQTNRN